MIFKPVDLIARENSDGNLCTFSTVYKSVKGASDFQVYG